MKTNIIALFILILGIHLSAQDFNTNVNGLKSEKQLKKERKEAEIERQYLATSLFLDSMQFVLEADYLSGSTGIRSMVTPFLNFILVDSTKGIIQTGRDSGFGSNGVGGATAKGTITNWKLTKSDKKKNFYVQIDFSTNLGFYTVFMDVSADGEASARLTGISRGSLTFDGSLIPLRKSKVFKAISGY